MLRFVPLALALVGCRNTAEPLWRPDVLMISLDTTQISRLDADTTPTLSALFDRSLVLEDHYSCSNWTFSSMICAMGGAYGLNQGFVPDYEVMPPAPDGLVMASEVLGRAGWRVGLVSSNPFLGGAYNTFPDAHDWVPLADGTPSDEVVAVAEPLLRELAEGADPFYLHVHFTDPHAPYSPPDSYREALDVLEPIEYDLDNDHGALRAMADDWPLLDDDTRSLVLDHLDARYRGELSFFDDQMAALLETAEELGLFEDGVVAFWTDHGEQLLEHGGVTHRDGVYEELTRSVVSISGAPWAPGVHAGPTTHADIWPTIFAEIDVVPGPSFTGLPVGERPEDNPRYGLKYLGNDSAQFVTRGYDKLIYHWRGEKMRFDLAADPTEQVNLYGQDPALEAALWELLLPKVQTAAGLTREGIPINPGP